MARRGRKRQLELETEYWRLRASGIGTVAACDAVGIGRKTGYRWRAETGGLAPDRLGETARTGRYLSLLERQRIATLRRLDLGVRAIAGELGRSPSTISRELRRHARRHDRGHYDGELAHARARQSARRARRTRIGRDEQLRRGDPVEVGVGVEPGADRRPFAPGVSGRPSWHLCHETIYQALYHGGKGGLSRSLTRRLRTGRRLRKRRRRADTRVVRFIAPARLIDARPAVVAERGRFGDWEGDLIVGPPAARPSARWSSGAAATCFSFISLEGIAPSTAGSPWPRCLARCPLSCGAP